MPRFAKIPGEVKAVFPMNQKYIGSTGINPKIKTKLDAIAQGLRTTTTRDNKQDIYAMHRLQPGDDIAFYNPTGDVVFGKYEDNYPVPQEIFYPNNAQVRRDYAIGEGGRPSYTDITLFNSFNPGTIPLDQSFSPGSGYKGLSGNSEVMKYRATSPLINFAGQLPSDSSLTGTMDRLPKSIANKIRNREVYEQQLTDTGFYKDSYVTWQDSPIPSQQGKGGAPYFQGNVEDAVYSDEMLAAAGLIRADDGKVYSVDWQNQDKQGVQPYIYRNGNREFLKNNPGNINIYKPIYIPENFTNYAFGNGAEKFGVTAPQQYYTRSIEPLYTNKSGNKVYQWQRSDKPIEDARFAAREMQSADRELGDINALINQGSRELKELYYGSTGEDSYDAIQELARSGGSGRWVDSLNDPDDYNVFKLGGTSQGEALVTEDLRRGGVGKYSRYNQTSTPAQYIPEWAGGITFNNKPYPIDTSSAESFNAEPMTSFRVYDQEENWNGITATYPTSEAYQIPTGYNNAPPASVLLNNAPQQYKQRNVQRLIPESQIPLHVQLAPYHVNEYGTIEKSLNTNRYPLSIQQYNNTLNLTQMSSGGRWMGGGLMDKGNGRHDGQFDPLVNERIRIPQGVAYKARLNSNHPEVKEAIRRDLTARQNAALIPEEKLVTQKDYEIDYGNTPLPKYDAQGRLLRYNSKDESDPRKNALIPGTNPGLIEGAYLPALVENQLGYFDQQYIPYTPNEALLDQHLADVRIKVGNEYYPLTPEATTTKYLPSQKQLSQARDEMFGRRKLYQDGTFEEYEPIDVIPDDADVAKARNSAVYANPNIEGRLDIVGALDDERRKINILDSVVNRNLPYNITQGNGVKANNQYDLNLLASNPLYAMNQMVNLQAKYPEPITNNLRDSVLYGRGQGANYNQSKIRDDYYIVPGKGIQITNPNTKLDNGYIVNPKGGSRLDMMLLQQNPIYSINQIVELEPVNPSITKSLRSNFNTQGTPIGKSTSLNRFINEEEAARIEQQMTVRPTMKTEVISDDGIAYLTEIDDIGVYQSDLTGIVDSPSKKLSFEEVAQLLDTKLQNYQRAENTYNQLMNLEPQDEIIINATTQKPQQLINQMRALGMEAELTGTGQLRGRGSLTAGLPGTNMLDLPKTRVQTLNYVESPHDNPEEIQLHQMQQKINTGDIAVNKAKLFKQKRPQINFNIPKRQLNNNAILQSNTVEEFGSELNYPLLKSYVDFGYGTPTIQNNVETEAEFYDYTSEPSNSTRTFRGMMPFRQITRNTDPPLQTLIPKQKPLGFNRGDIANQLDPTDLYQFQNTGDFDIAFNLGNGFESINHSYFEWDDGFSPIVNDQLVTPSIQPQTISHSTVPRTIDIEDDTFSPPYTPLQQPTSEPAQTISQSPQWLRPGLIGAGVLGIAGLSNYYQQQQYERDMEEAQMRAMRLY